MIRSSEDNHEFVLFMFYFRNSQFWIFSFEIIWINKSCLMPQELLTRTEMFWEYFLSLPLDNVLVLMIYSIPKFRFTLVDQIYTRKIKVLCMPAEESFPTTNIAVRSVNALHSVGKGIIQNRI